MSIFSIFTHNPKQPAHLRLNSPKWKHSLLNYPIRTKKPLYKKKGQRRRKKHSNHVGSGFAIPKCCMWKGNGRQAHQKYRPKALVLCGQCERVGTSTNDSLLETGQSDSVQLSVRGTKNYFFHKCQSMKQCYSNSASQPYLTISIW